jgi:hypothetical protein
MMLEPFSLAYDFAKRFRSVRLLMIIQKAEHAYQSKAPDTIGHCKNVLECICKEILNEKGETVNSDIKLEKLLIIHRVELPFDRDENRWIAENSIFDY